MELLFRTSNPPCDLWNEQYVLASAGASPGNTAALWESVVPKGPSGSAPSIPAGIAVPCRSIAGNAIQPAVTLPLIGGGSQAGRTDSDRDSERTRAERLAPRGGAVRSPEFPVPGLQSEVRRPPTLDLGHRTLDGGSWEEPECRVIRPRRSI